jgi:hypothetical protein
VLPEWWGVLLVETGGAQATFRQIRAALPNPAPDTRTLVELLWREDAVSLLNQHGLGRGIGGKSRSVIWDRLCRALPADVIGAAVRANLKARRERLGH